MNKQESDESKTSKNKNLPVGYFLWGGIALVVITLSFYFSHFHKKFSTSNGDWGTFGDFLGGTLNPVFSFASFIALLFTINLQREELDKSTQELAKSTLALNKQFETQSKQQFENTFFSLLDQHNKLLEVHQKQIREALRSIVLSHGSPPLFAAKAILRRHNASIGQYFRVLYQLLKLIATNVPNTNIGPDFAIDEIKDSELAPNEKMYSNIVRSFLNYNVTQLLAINCFCSSDQDSFIKFKLLIERYAFLEHMPFHLEGYDTESETLLELKSHYDRKAFGNSQFI